MRRSNYVFKISTQVILLIILSFNVNCLGLRKWRPPERRDPDPDITDRVIDALVPDRPRGSGTASTPKEISQVESMLVEKSLYDFIKNINGPGIQHLYKSENLNGSKVIIDGATGLTWQQSGSPRKMTFEQAQEYIRKLNENNFAGFDKWRLPTLEEAMSLMEPTVKNGNFHIDSLFDQQQRRIWTSERFRKPKTFSPGSLEEAMYRARPPQTKFAMWLVTFKYGYCYHDCACSHAYVRAVR